MTSMSTQCFLALSAALLGGCASTGADAGKARHVSDLSSYVPLAVGISYTYEMRYPGQVGEMSVSYVGQKDGYIVDDKNGAFRLTADGLRDRDRYLVKLPPEVGTAWRTVVGPSAVEHAQIISVGQPCEAVAGKFFDCLTVHSWIKHSEKMTLHIEWTWAKDVGLVKLETTADVAGKGKLPQVKQSLKSYTIGGQTHGPAAAPAAEGKGPDDGPSTWSQ